MHIRIADDRAVSSFYLSSALPKTNFFKNWLLFLYPFLMILTYFMKNNIRLTSLRIVTIPVHSSRSGTVHVYYIFFFTIINTKFDKENNTSRP